MEMYIINMESFQVCMTCLATDTKMFLMSKYKLIEVYETLTGNTVSWTSRKINYLLFI